MTLPARTTWQRLLLTIVVVIATAVANMLIAPTGLASTVANPNTYVPNPTTAIDPLGLNDHSVNENATKSADEVAEATSNVPKITFGHGARHLEGTGLGVEEVESTILQQVATAASKATSGTGSFWDRIEIRGTTIEYRAYTLPDGTINVGTYYVP